MIKHVLVIFSLIELLAPVSARAQDKYMQIQMLRRAIDNLQSERTEKYNRLVACERESNKYTIAGISAISTATIGFSINTKLQAKLNKLDASGRGGGGLGSDSRSEEESCHDEKVMYCAVGTPGYNEANCQLYTDAGC